jgi:5-formyltetrahydrofolate cyclo-ligase
MDWPETKAWRRTAREKILAARAAIALPVRQAMARRLIEHLRTALKDRPDPISFYWPIKAEPDLRPLMEELDAAGMRVCLPVCIKLGLPLTFRPWKKGCAMVRGFWNIPVPAAEEKVQPRTLIAPFVGYDPAGYRLGYGGGFFDRTLAQYGPESSAIGIGWSMCRLETIQPQPHDIRMSAIVTQTGIALQDQVKVASDVCYLNEAEADYAGFHTPAEIAGALDGLRGLLPPERVGLLDYALWRLNVPADQFVAPTGATPSETLARLLPRIRDDAVHAAVAALAASLAI